MSLPATVPPAIIDVVVGFLLPLILGTCGGDEAAARAAALRLLAEPQPRTGNELLLAGAAIAFRLRGLARLVQSAEPDLSPDAAAIAEKSACGLLRTGDQAQRRLDEALRAAPRGADAAAPVADATPPLPEPSATTGTAAAPDGAASGAETPAQAGAADGAEPAPPAEPAMAITGSLVAQLEEKLRSAEKLLNMMKAYHKGAPPPHGKAAQD